MTFALRPILAIACLLAACSRGPTTDSAPYTEQAAIVAGQAEAGFEAVGALTYFRGGRYFGTFCIIVYFNCSYFNVSFILNGKYSGMFRTREMNVIDLDIHM